MFERCDRDAMTILDAAVDEARRLGHGVLGTEHVLVGFAEHRGLLTEPVASLLPNAQTVRARVAESVGGPVEGPAELLRRVGVDLDAVRSAVRRTFGDDAVERLGRPVHQPWQPWRRPSRRCTSMLAATISAAPRLKQAFEHARRHAAQRDVATISPADLLLGMIEVEDALSNRLLRDAGIEPNHIRRLLTGTDG